MHAIKDIELPQMASLVTGAANLGVHLNIGQINQFHRYFLEMAKWNVRTNLTSITGCEEVQVKHFMDSLTASLAIPSEFLTSGRAVDIGSGAGFPGMALKIAFPKLQVTLVEASGKKTKFLRHIGKVLELKELEIREGRSEVLAHDPNLRERFDLVLTRAVARMNVLAEITLPFCRLGGRVVAHKSAHPDVEVGLAQQAIETLGGILKEIKKVSVQGLDINGSLVVIEKITLTPMRYPRRPGMPKKRPL